jgi:hypothetical protein
VGTQVSPRLERTTGHRRERASEQLWILERMVEVVITCLAELIGWYGWLLLLSKLRVVYLLHVAHLRLLLHNLRKLELEVQISSLRTFYVTHRAVKHWQTPVWMYSFMLLFDALLLNDVRVRAGYLLSCSQIGKCDLRVNGLVDESHRDPVVLLRLLFVCVYDGQPFWGRYLAHCQDVFIGLRLQSDVRWRNQSYLLKFSANGILLDVTEEGGSIPWLFVLDQRRVVLGIAMLHYT